MAREFESSSNEYVEIGDVPALNITGDEITVSAWVRLESATAEMKVLAKWSDAAGAFSYLLAVQGVGDDKALFAVNTGSNGLAQGTTVMPVGQWFHIAGTYDGSDARVYLDGAEDASTSKSGNLSSNSAPVRIGAGSGGAGTEQPFDGDIGHCAIWDAPLSAGEIKSLAAGVSPLKIRRGNLLSYSPLNGQDPELDVVGGLDLTVVGSIKSEEPPISNSVVAP